VCGYGNHNLPMASLKVRFKRKHRSLQIQRVNCDKLNEWYSTRDCYHRKTVRRALSVEILLTDAQLNKSFHSKNLKGH